MHSSERWARMWGWKCDTCHHPITGLPLGSRKPLNHSKAKRNANRHIRKYHAGEELKAEELMYKIGKG